MTGRNTTTQTRQDKVNPTVRSGLLNRSSLQLTASDKLTKEPIKKQQESSIHNNCSVVQSLKKLASLTRNFSKMSKYTQKRNHSHLPKDITDLQL